MGYGENKGIIPRACEEIFRRIKERDDDPNIRIRHEVKLQMIQIYNERVQDLLVKKSKVEDLQVREGPNGVYVQDCSEVPVNSYEEIQYQIDTGTANRAIGQTNMNATSSRAHTISQVIFTQNFFDEDGKPSNRLQSTINLIDLAGSERAGSTGAEGARLLEGANINKSLMTLGRVISTLAKNATVSKS